MIIIATTVPVGQTCGQYKTCVTGAYCNNSVCMCSSTYYTNNYQCCKFKPLKSYFFMQILKKLNLNLDALIAVGQSCTYNPSLNSNTSTQTCCCGSTCTTTVNNNAYCSCPTGTYYSYFTNGTCRNILNNFYFFETLFIKYF